MNPTLPLFNPPSKNYKTGSGISEPTHKNRNVVAVIRNIPLCKGLGFNPSTVNPLMHSLHDTTGLFTLSSNYKPPTIDPDNMVLRTGNRAPWTAATPSLGVPSEVGTTNYTDVLQERRQFECAKGYDQHEIQKQIQLIICTAREQRIYICTEQTGANWQTNQPIAAVFREPESPSAAAQRLCIALFPWHKTIQRAVHKATKRTPYTFTAVSPQGNSIHTTQWGLRLSAGAAAALPPPQKQRDDSNMSDNLSEISRTKWVDSEQLSISMKTQPFSGAELKGVAHWTNELFRTETPTPLTPVEAKLLVSECAQRPVASDRAASRLPLPVSRWLYGKENELEWAMNDTHSPTMNSETLPRLVASAQRLPQNACEIKKLQLTVNMARERAQANGCSIISARDLIESAQALQYEVRHGGPRPTPHDQPPQHYCSLQLALARLAEVNAQNVIKGISRPWVLVCCESSAIISRHFHMAGFQVASCDLSESEDNTTPHFRGDCRKILHLGFDLIIGCPPCTFLSNCSVPWLHVEPHRWVSMREASLLFRQIYNAPNCPYVVLENPVMSKYARQLLGGLKPTYFTNPSAHGHDSSKPTGLYIRGELPPLQPTCLITDPDRRLRNLAPGPERGKTRGRFFIGVAAAMACQWGSTIIEYNCKKETKRARPDLSEIIRELNADESQLKIDAPVVASLSAKEGHNRTKHVAAVLPSGTARVSDQQETAWVLCPHGATLVAGPEQLLDELTSNDPMPRCERTECVQDNIEWWAKQKEAAAYTKSLAPSSLRHNDDYYRPYPIKRIGKKGSLWYVWHPCPSRSSIAGHYKWSRLSQPTQDVITDEIDRIKCVRIGDDGMHTTNRVAHLYPQLPVICDDDSKGFKPLQYELERTTPKDVKQWETMRRNLEKIYTRCPSCGTERSAGGRQKCRCNPSLGARERSSEDKKPLYTADCKIKGKMARKTCSPYCEQASKQMPRTEIKFIKASICTITDTKSIEAATAIQRAVASKRDRPKSMSCVAAIVPQCKQVSPKLASQVHKVINQAAKYGVAPTPRVNNSDGAYCAYLADLIVVDDNGTLPLKSYDVACFVKWSLGDTGAGVSILAADLLKLLPSSAVGKIVPTAKHGESGVSTVDGTPLLILGTVELTFHLANRLFRHEFQVVEGGDLLILGNDFIAAHEGSVHPRMSNNNNKGWMELNHEISGTRVRSPLIPTPKNWEPVRERSNQPPGNKPRLGSQVGGVDSGDPVPTTQNSKNLRNEISVNILGAVVPTKVNRVAAVTCSHVKAPTTHFVDVTVKDGEEVVHKEEPFLTSSENLAELTIITPDPSMEELYDKYLVRKEHVLVSHLTLQVPPRSERTVQVKLPKSLISHEGDLLILPLPYRKGLRIPSVSVAASVCKANGEFVAVRLINASRQIVHIAATTALATIECDVETPAAGEPDNMVHTWNTLTETQKETIKKGDLDPDKILSEKQMSQALDLLAKYVHVFAPNKLNPGKTHLAEIELPLKPGSKPHRHAPSRLGPEGNKIAQDMIDKLEEHGIVQRSNSAWASRLVIVKKKSGENRVCVDLRDLNSKLLVHDCPLPRCDDSIARLAATPEWNNESGRVPTKSVKLYMTIDLASGFYCVPVKESDKDKLAFVTERAKYTWNFMPFGITSAPAYFQTMMEAVLSGLSPGMCMAYLDDVCIWATGATLEEAFEQALERLGLVLERLAWAGLTANAGKTILFALSIAYLGHVVHQTGVSPCPQKIIGVSKINPRDIRCISTVRSFLGLTGYYRNFINNYHVLSGPLTSLTKKNVDVKLESQKPEVQEAIIKLKDALTSAPVLAPPRSDRPFIIHCDAATNHGIGGILVQKDDDEEGNHAMGGERPVSFYGRRFNDAERNYTVTESELLGVLESIKHFRPYLYGRHFTIVTDHAALRWLHTMKESVAGGASSRLTRWSLKLQEYSFDVVHKAGKMHHDADAISRLVGCIRPTRKGDAQGTPDRKLGVQTWPFNRRLDDLHAAMKGKKNVAHVLGTCDSSQVPLGQSGAMQATVAAIVLRGDAEDKDFLLHPSVRIAAVSAHDALRKSQLCSDVPRAEALREAQQADPDCIDIMNYLISGLTDTEPKRIKWVASQSEKCEIREGLLCHIVAIDNVSVSRIWVPHACREGFLYAYHDQMGHPSRDRMYQLMQRSVYWPGLSTDVQTHLAECHQCSFSKKGSRKNGATQPPQVGLYPMDLIIADILSMKETADGYTKVIIFACSLSRWVETIPLKKDPTSEEVLDIFMTNIVCRHGCPRCIRSDCGSNLTSKLCKEVYRLCNVDLAQSTAYHHASAGIVERFNHTLTEMTKASDPTEGDEWVKHLPFLTFAYNSTPHRVTKQSPACLIYGRDLRLPQNIDLHGAAPTKDEGNLSSYARSIYDRLRIAWDMALRHTYVSQADSAERVDVKRHLHLEFEMNDRVLVRIETPHLHKLAYKWSGPFRISEVLGKGVYQLRDLHSRRTLDRVAVDRLRPYLTVTDIEPVAPDEWIVKDVLGHRTVPRDTPKRGEKRQFLIHWRGFPKNEATWTDEENLLVRCADLVAQYLRNQQDDPKVPANKHTNKRKSKQKLLNDVLTSPAKALPDATSGRPKEKSIYPSGADAAQYARGAWAYKVYFPTSRGWKPRWLPTNNFTEKELVELKPLREVFLKETPLVGALIPVASQVALAKKPQPRANTPRAKSRINLRGGGPAETSVVVNRCFDDPDLLRIMTGHMLLKAMYEVSSIHQTDYFRDPRLHEYGMLQIEDEPKFQYVRRGFALKALSKNANSLHALASVSKTTRLALAPVCRHYEELIQFRLIENLNKYREYFINMTATDVREGRYREDDAQAALNPPIVETKDNTVIRLGDRRGPRFNALTRKVRHGRPHGRGHLRETNDSGECQYIHRWIESVLYDHRELIYPETDIRLITRRWPPRYMKNPERIKIYLRSCCGDKDCTCSDTVDIFSVSPLAMPQVGGVTRKSMSLRGGGPTTTQSAETKDFTACVRSTYQILLERVPHLRNSLETDREGRLRIDGTTRAAANDVIMDYNKRSEEGSVRSVLAVLTHHLWPNEFTRREVCERFSTSESSYRNWKMKLSSKMTITPPQLRSPQHSSVVSDISPNLPMLAMVAAAEAKITPEAMSDSPHSVPYDLADCEPPTTPPTAQSQSTEVYTDARGRRQAAKAIFYDRPSGHIYCWHRNNGGNLDTPGGTRTMADASLEATLLRECLEEVHLPDQIVRDIQPHALFRLRTASTHVNYRDQLYLVKAWFIPTSMADLQGIRQTTEGIREGNGATTIPAAEFEASSIWAGNIDSFLRITQAQNDDLPVAVPGKNLTHIEPDGDGSQILPPDTQVGGSSKLDCIFNAMDALAVSTSNCTEVKELAEAMGQRSPRIATLEAIRGVILRLIHPETYPDDQDICHLMNVKLFLLNAWRYKIYVVGHQEPVPCCDIAKVVFLCLHTCGLFVFAGARQHCMTNPEGPQLDLPGGKARAGDHDARGTVWREAADEQLALSPKMRARLARTLSSTPPTMASQHDSGGNRNRLALWTNIMIGNECDEVVYADQGRKEWDTAEWVPIETLILNLRTHQSNEFATAIRKSIEDALLCREHLFNRGYRNNFSSD